MFSSHRVQRAIAIIYAGIAFGLLHYWWQFHRGDIFPIIELSKIEPNIYQFYLLEKSLSKAELGLVASLISCSLSIWLSNKINIVRSFAAFNAGACFCLSVVSLSLGFGSGLYRIAHDYADIALEADLSLLFVGLVSAFACALLAFRSDSQ